MIRKKLAKTITTAALIVSVVAGVLGSTAPLTVCAATDTSSAYSQSVSINNPSIYIQSITRDTVTAGMVCEAPENTDIEYSWYVSKDKTSWTCIQDWKVNDEWLNWSPNFFGEFQLKGLARVKDEPLTTVVAVTTQVINPYIKGKCQLPYGMIVPGESGYLIGVETYENPNQSYQYEMLILDCTLLAEGKDAWIYTTNKFTVSEGAAGWTVWQPKYGYYWTLFRVYDADGNMIDEACYGFQNIAGSMDGTISGTHTHAYTPTIIVDATHETEGVVDYTCECGDSYRESIPTSGHVIKEYTFNYDSTTEADGTMTGYCESCGARVIKTAEGTKLTADGKYSEDIEGYYEGKIPSEIVEGEVVFDGYLKDETNEAPAPLEGVEDVEAYLAEHFDKIWCGGGYYVYMGDYIGKIDGYLYDELSQIYVKSKGHWTGPKLNVLYGRVNDGTLEIWWVSSNEGNWKWNWESNSAGLYGYSTGVEDLGYYDEGSISHGYIYFLNEQN